MSKRIEAGEDPYPITFCQRVPSKVYEKEKVLGVQTAMLDLLDHIVNDKNMSSREKKKKLKKIQKRISRYLRSKISYTRRLAREFDKNDVLFAFETSHETIKKLKTSLWIF